MAIRKERHGLIALGLAVVVLFLAAQALVIWQKDQSAEGVGALAIGQIAFAHPDFATGSLGHIATELADLSRQVRRAETAGNTAQLPDLCVRVQTLTPFIRNLRSSLEGQDREAAAAIYTELLTAIERLPKSTRPFARGNTDGLDDAIQRLSDFAVKLDQAIPFILRQSVQAPEDLGSIGATERFILVAAVLLLGTLIIGYGVVQARRMPVHSAYDVQGEVPVWVHDFESIISSLSEGFLLLDEQERIVAANSAYLRISNCCPTTAMFGNAFVDFQRTLFAQGCVKVEGFEDADAYARYRLDKLRRCDQGWELHLTDGRSYLVSDQKIAGGGYVSTLTEITRQKSTEDKLRSQLAAMDLSTDGIAILCDNGSIEYANGALARLLGFEEAGDVEGHSWLDFYPDDTLFALVSKDLSGSGDVTDWRGETAARLADGGLMNQEVSVTRLPQGQSIAVVRSIEERKAAEKAQQKVQEQIFQSQKMDAIGRLAGGIAHDFNNILASILGYASLLEEDLSRQNEQREFVRNIRAGGERARQLVQQILAFSKNQNDVSQVDVDLRGAVKETVAMLRATLPVTLQLKLTMDTEPCAVRGNPSQLGQVIMNLCVNARDAVGEAHGTIGLAVSRSNGAALISDLAELPLVDPNPHSFRFTDPDAHGWSSLITGTVESARDYAVLDVEDDGDGIDPATMRRILEPFFTTKPVDKGTGLGLAAVHGIVSGHGGALIVSSKPGTGTFVRVLLPEGEAQTLESAEIDATGYRRGLGRILIAEDEPAVAEFVATLLRRAGYEVVELRNGTEALDYLMREGFDAVDLVLSDETMPRLTGSELLAAIRRDGHTLPFILCTGYSDTLDSETAGRLGASAFLEKPVAPAKLTELIADLIAAHSEGGARQVTKTGHLTAAE